METHFLLAFGEEEFLAPLAMTGSEAFFNKLLKDLSSFFGKHAYNNLQTRCLWMKTVGIHRDLHEGQCLLVHYRD